LKKGARIDVKDRTSGLRSVVDEEES
jgi:hypothetical protein